jgi:hypothetical protein
MRDSQAMSFEQRKRSNARSSGKGDVGKPVVTQLPQERIKEETRATTGTPFSLNLVHGAFKKPIVNTGGAQKLAKSRKGDKFAVVKIKSAVNRGERDLAALLSSKRHQFEVVGTATDLWWVRQTFAAEDWDIAGLVIEVLAKLAEESGQPQPLGMDLRVVELITEKVAAARAKSSLDRPLANPLDAMTRLPSDRYVPPTLSVKKHRHHRLIGEPAI